MPEPIPDILVELLLLGELDEQEAAAVKAQLEAEGDPRLAEFQASDAEIFDAYPPERVVAELRESQEDDNVVRPSWISPVVVAATVLAAVGLLWIVWPSGDTTSPPERVATRQPVDDPGIRDKGTMRLLIHREGDDAPLPSGASVREGDLLQLSYAGTSTHGVIASVDGSGVATLHFPDTEDGNTRLDAGLVRLDHAYELDDAPDFERFFLISADVPLDPEEILDQVRLVGRTDSLELPAEWAQASVLLAKPPAR